MQDSGSTPLTPQDYLTRLRERRLNRLEPVQATTGQAQIPPEPVTSQPIAAPTDQPPSPQAPGPTTPVAESSAASAGPSPSYAPGPVTEPAASEQPLTQAEWDREQQRRSAFQESQLFPGQFVPVPEETIVEWKAPSRPFKKRNRQFYTTVAIITGLISLILFFAGQFLPIAVVIAVAFLAYVLSSVPPEEVTNKITTWGIHTEDKVYYWEEMGRFWFDTRFTQRLIMVEVARFPGRLTLMVGSQNEEDLKQLLSEVLINEKPKDTFYDKASKWLQDKIPLDND